jgi:adenylate kinase
MRLILLGAPGSGKGTQAYSISDYFKIKRISLGDLLREEVHRETDLGKQVKQYMEAGVLVPDQTVSLVIAHNLDQEGFVLDGYPRNISQGKTLDEILKEKKLQLDVALFLDVKESIVIERLSGRRVCRQCQANYHIHSLPSKVEGVCDNCQGALIQRSDDTRQVIEKRWTVFQEETGPLIEYYQEREILITIDANRGIKQVFEDIVAKLKNGKCSLL